MDWLALTLGANLTTRMNSDPGFFQLQQVFEDFRRFLRKIPDLLEMWALFVQNFDGERFAGPSCKLLEQCELVDCARATAHCG